MRLEKHSLVLLQGDSITDAGRSRTNDDDLGRGYAGMVSAWVSAAGELPGLFADATYPDLCRRSADECRS